MSNHPSCRGFLLGDCVVRRAASSPSRRSVNSGDSRIVANSLIRRLIRLRSTSGWKSSSVAMSARSMGRDATAFMTMRSSTRGRHSSVSPTRTTTALLMLSSSKGIAPREISTLVLSDSCMSNRTRDLSAKPSGSSMRGTKPEVVADSRNAAQPSSSIATTISTSRVVRGLLSSETATPPITRYGVPVELNQSCRARNVGSSCRMVSSGMASLSQTNPALPHFRDAVVLILVAARCGEREEPFEVAKPLFHGSGQSFPYRKFVHQAPSLAPGDKFSFGHLPRHISKL